MTTDWKRVRQIFELALDIETGARASFVREASSGDASVQCEVEALLVAHARPGDFLDAPAVLPTEIATSRELRGLPSPTEAAVGTVVDDKYIVDGILGTGGMGAVYRARHLQLERPVALKLIRGDLLAQPTMAERFRREAVTVARLRHPHIVVVHDYGVAAGLGAYLVMELLEGLPLRKILTERGRLDPPEALQMIAQVCRAVGSAHRAGVVHRDIKPENIFLEDRDGASWVKVLDFGIAKLGEAFHQGAGTLTTAGALLGTPAYMSPEQCRGEDVDERSDVYSLGCVAFEMLTGRRPFLGPNIASLVFKHINEPSPRPSELAPDLAETIDEALMRALAKSPAERYQTPEAFARALGAAGAQVSTATAVQGVDTRSDGRSTAAVERIRAGKRPGNSLPQPITRFIGRGGQVDEVRDLLARERLVTLAGPGGIGKTRLAIEVSAGVADAFEDGVWLVELAALAEPGLVPHAVASALDVREQAGRPVEQGLAEWLREKRVLVVFDNCEHVIEACAHLIEGLLGACAGLYVLATSREALGVAGEAVWAVPALDVPSEAAGLDDVMRSDAARLFVDRAALGRPGFALTPATAPAVLALCRRLEGIPLAIELAAARARVLSVEEILARLDDRFRLLSGGSRTAPSRQQTLRAALDWSYDLLTEDERALLRRLSVFAGGWTLEGAEAIARSEVVVIDEETRLRRDGAVAPRLDASSSRSGRDFRVANPLDVLGRLVDKSLVTVHERGPTTRYGMLEMIREYGLEFLDDCGEAEAVRDLHAEYVLSFAETAESAVRDGQSTDWVDRLEEEHDNIRAALSWLAGRDAARCLRLAVAVNQFRALRGYLTEARRWLEIALERGDGAPANLMVSALLGAGFVAVIQGDLKSARGFYERGVPLAAESGDATQAAALTYGLGTLADMEGDRSAARSYLGESLAQSRAAGNLRLAGESLNGLGEVARGSGDWDAAMRYYEEAIAIFRAIGQEHSPCVVLCNLGAAACESGDLEKARACYAEALDLVRSLGSKEFLSLCLDGFGAVAARRGDAPRAARLAGAAQALLEEIGATPAPTDLAFRDRYVALAREHLGDAAVETALAEGRGLPTERVLEYALAT